MTPDHPSESPAAITLEDIYYVLFRHKKKLIFCALVGLIAALAFWITSAPPWQSEAKLLIRYVAETRSPSAVANDANIKSPDVRGDNILNTEIEIMTSLDLAEKVADSIGPEKILAKINGGANRDFAAAVIRKNLEVEAPQRSSVIRIVFKHPDANVVQPVLKNVVDTYFKTHLEIHRAGGIVQNFLTLETTQLHIQLAVLEKNLREARNKAGVLSLEDAKKTAIGKISRLREEIFSAEADLAERQAAVEQLTKLIPAHPETTNTTREPSPGGTENYRNVCARLNVLWAKEGELLTQYTEETSMVQQIRHQIAEAEKLKKKLEEENPGLLTLGSFSPAQPGQPNAAALSLTTETTRAASLASRIKVLNSQLAQIRAEASNVDQMEPDIQELQRKKDLADTHYRNLSASLEQYNIDDALGAEKGLNISRIQAPSPPFREAGKQQKIMFALLAGGLLGGIAWVFLIDLYIDHSIKRPKDIEMKLGLPLFLSIPDTSRKSGRRVAEQAANGRLALEEGAVIPAGSDTASWTRQRLMRPYFEALGGRVITNLEASNVSHSPKLIAVTGIAEGSGVSTIASGLAAWLSETGDGNVLLVDMNAGLNGAHTFYKGKPICELETALESESRDKAQMHDNLYVASEASNNNLLRLLPKRFTSLVPKLKSSDYDYIVFDMPPVSQTSVTPRLAGHMDIILLVLESEKSGIRQASRAGALLRESQPNMVTVLNKHRPYVPAALSQE